MAGRRLVGYTARGNLVRVAQVEDRERCTHDAFLVGEPLAELQVAAQAMYARSRMEMVITNILDLCGNTQERRKDS